MQLTTTDLGVKIFLFFLVLCGASYVGHRGWEIIKQVLDTLHEDEDEDR